MWKLPTVGPIAGIDCLSILQFTTYYNYCLLISHERMFTMALLYFCTPCFIQNITRWHGLHRLPEEGGPPVASSSALERTASAGSARSSLCWLMHPVRNQTTKFILFSLNGLFQSLTSKNRCSVKLVAPPKPRQVLQTLEQLVLITLTLVWGLNFLIHSAKKMVKLIAVCDLPSWARTCSS